MKKLMMVLAVLAVFGLATAQAAVNNFLVTSGTGQWSVNSNWDYLGEPFNSLGNTDVVFNASGGPLIVNITSGFHGGAGTDNNNIRSLTVAGGDVTISSTNGSNLATYAGVGEPHQFSVAGGSTLTIALPFATNQQNWDKTGDGVINFTSGTSYIGNYGVNRIIGGTLLCNSTSANYAPQNYANMTVQTGATLGGAGYIGGSANDGRNDIVIQSGGKLSPGAVATVGTAGTLTMHLNSSPGLDIGGAVTGDSASMLFDLVAPGTSDMVAFTTGLLTIGSAQLDLNDFAFSGTAEAGTYTLFDGYQAISGTLGSVLTGTVLGYDAELAFSGDSQDVLLTLSGGTPVIPEPAGLGLMGVALLALRRRRS